MELPTHKELCDALDQLKKTRDEITLEISMMETVIMDRYKGNPEPPLVSIGQGDNAQHTHDSDTWQRGNGFTTTEVKAEDWTATIITPTRRRTYSDDQGNLNGGD